MPAGRRPDLVIHRGVILRFSSLFFYNSVASLRSAEPFINQFYQNCMVNISKRDDDREDGRSVVPHSPFSLIDQFLNDEFMDPFHVMMGRRLASVSGAFPKVDVTETDTEIKVVANIPGIDPDKVNVEVGDDYLSLSGKVEKETKDEDKKGKVYRYEREYGEFRREFTLPSRVDKDKIVARAKNGVLTLTLPKIGDEKRKKISVEVEK